jgi:hypothetical protein
MKNLGNTKEAEPFLFRKTETEHTHTTKRGSINKAKQTREFKGK